jgi:hypothetical protein
MSSVVAVTSGKSGGYDRFLFALLVKVAKWVTNSVLYLVLGGWFHGQGNSDFSLQLQSSAPLWCEYVQLLFSANPDLEPLVAATCSGGDDRRRDLVEPALTRARRDPA